MIKNNNTKFNKNKNYNLLYKYGLTLKEYNDKLSDQKNGCWICGAEGKNRSLHVDHKHVRNYKKMKKEDKRKYVRGLLCFRCNVFVGKVERYKENWLEIMKKTASYLLVHQI